MYLSAEMLVEDTDIYVVFSSDWSHIPLFYEDFPKSNLPQSFDFDTMNELVIKSKPKIHMSIFGLSSLLVSYKSYTDLKPAVLL